MALHAPTSFDLTYDETALSSGQQIRTTVPTVVVQNQQYAAERSRLLLSTVFVPSYTAAAGWTTLLNDFGVVGPNLLGISVTASLSGVVYAWVDDGATGGNVRAYNAASGTLSVAVGVGATAKQWHALAGAFAVTADGTEWTFDVDAQVTAGTGNIYVAGVGLFY